MMALSSGEKSNITSAVRREIIAAVSTLVMVHTTYPTPEEYSCVCELLIKKYPLLTDSFGCGFVSCFFNHGATVSCIRIQLVL